MSNTLGASLAAQAALAKRFGGTSCSHGGMSCSHGGFREGTDNDGSSAWIACCMGSTGRKLDCMTKFGGDKHGGSGSGRIAGGMDCSNS